MSIGMSVASISCWETVSGEPEQNDKKPGDSLVQHRLAEIRACEPHKVVLHTGRQDMHNGRMDIGVMVRLEAEDQQEISENNAGENKKEKTLQWSQQRSLNERT